MNTARLTDWCKVLLAIALLLLLVLLANDSVRAQAENPASPPVTQMVTTGLLTNIKAIAAGAGHTCTLTTGGGVKCWGTNASGELGDGTGGTDRLTLVDVIGLTSGVHAITAGFDHTCALTIAGGVKCWGANFNGQLGDGTGRNERWTPVDVIGLTSGVQMVAAGAIHTCALTVSGAVKCWGANSEDQLGDGSNESEHWTPVEVIGLASGVQTITAGATHTCALTTEGGVKCWGTNREGQLGDGTTTRRPTLVDVIGLASGVQTIQAGGDDTCALTTGGSIKCWGDNRDGQLGDGTTTDRYIPVDVSGLSRGVQDITAGGHTCALTSGGVKCWGNNWSGQLGDGTTTNRLTPVDVSGLSSGVQAIAGGGSHTCALAISGSVKCWGNNFYGQLGDGTGNDRWTPVDVIDPNAALTDAANLDSQMPYPTVEPGAALTIWINVRNTGSSTWQASDGYTWRGEDGWAGQSGAIAGPVAPNEVWPFALDMVAPSTPGKYHYGFMLQHNGVEFGPYFFIEVTVKEPESSLLGDLGFRVESDGFSRANMQSSRDWDMFRQYFGAANVQRADGTACQPAQIFFNEQYRNAGGGWSCFGFASASAVNYMKWPQPIAGPYSMPNYDRLHEQPWSGSFVKPIAFYAGTQTAQQASSEYGAWLSKCNQPLSSIMNELAQQLNARTPVILGLEYAPKSGHALIPFKLIQQPTGRYDLTVYDSEAPNTEQVIHFQVDGAAWTWTYTFQGSVARYGTETKDCTKMYILPLSWVTEQGVPPVDWCSTNGAQSAFGQQLVADTNYVYVSLPAADTSMVLDSQGRRLGTSNGEWLNEIPGSIGLPETTLAEATKHSYYLPEGTYTLVAPLSSTAQPVSLFADGAAALLTGTDVSTAAHETQVSPDLTQLAIQPPGSDDSVTAMLVQESAGASNIYSVTLQGASEAAPIDVQVAGGKLRLHRDAGNISYIFGHQTQVDVPGFTSELMLLSVGETHTLYESDNGPMLDIDRNGDGKIDESIPLAPATDDKSLYLPLINK